MSFLHLGNVVAVTKIFLLGILIIILLGVVGFVISLGNSPDVETNNQTEQNVESNTQPEQTSPIPPTTLKIEDIVVGEGKEAAAGQFAVVHYTGTLLDGTKFDSSLDRGQPFQFLLGAGQVIQGWDQGVAGMKVGGKRKLTIPSDLAYGASPGHRLQNETLIFEVELLDVVEQ